MTQSVTNKISTTAKYWQKHTDPPGLWIFLFVASMALHLLALWLLSQYKFGSGSVGQSSSVVPIELIEISPTKKSPAKPKLKPKPKSKPLVKVKPVPPKVSTSQKLNSAPAPQAAKTSSENQNSGAIAVVEDKQVISQQRQKESRSAQQNQSSEEQTSDVNSKINNNASRESDSPPPTEQNQPQAQTSPESTSQESNTAKTDNNSPQGDSPLATEQNQPQAQTSLEPSSQESTTAKTENDSSQSDSTPPTEQNQNQNQTQTSSEFTPQETTTAKTENNSPPTDSTSPTEQNQNQTQASPESMGDYSPNQQNVEIGFGNKTELQKLDGTFVSFKPQPKLLTRDIPDLPARPIGETQEIRLSNDMGEDAVGCQQENFVVWLVIDVQGKANVAALDPKSDIPPLEKEKCRKYVDEILKIQQFDPATNKDPVTGEQTPVMSNLPILINIEQRQP